MKVLVTGADGMLGTALCPIFAKRGHNVLATDLVPSNEGSKHLDVRNYNEVKEMVEKVKPDIVIHLAAETDVQQM